VWIAILYLLGNSYVLEIPFLSFTNLGAILIMLYLPIGLILGSVVGEGLTLLGPRRRSRVSEMVIALTLAAGFVASHVRITDIEPYRYFVTSSDVEAMQWIRENTPEDAMFAVNTHFWLPQAPHGTDAGYWIPYFTGRQTTAGSMLLYLGPKAYVSEIVDLSRSVEQLEGDDPWPGDLQAQGIDYIYIGQKGDFSGKGLQANELQQSEAVDVVYKQGDVTILQMSPSGGSRREGEEG
jgi:hypothetical protein